MIKFILGFLLGAPFGVTLMACMVCGKLADKRGKHLESHQDGYHET